MTQVGMKTIHLLITTLAFVASGHVIAQTYYGKSEVIVRDTVKYVCINEGGAISLYNQDAVFVNVPQTLKNGEPMNTAISYEDMLSKPCYDLPEGLVNAMSKLLHAAFAPYEQYLPPKNNRILIFLYVAPNESGKVKDVVFEMVESYDNYIHVPPEVFMMLEKKLKNMKIPVTAFGRQFNYLTVPINYRYIK